jgi:excisionase family DNA binding protein
VSNLSLPEAAAVWGVSRRTAYRLAELGLVRVARFGRRMTVPAEEVERVRLEGVAEIPAPVPALPRRGRPAASGESRSRS